MAERTHAMGITLAVCLGRLATFRQLLALVHAANRVRSARNRIDRPLTPPQDVDWYWPKREVCGA